MILIGLGSNVEGPWGSPDETVLTALKMLDTGSTRVARASRLLLSRPMGEFEQPDYVNAAAVIATKLTPQQLMQHLHDLELAAGRRRSVKWGPRTLDLDLLDYEGIILPGKTKGQGCQEPLILPHPGISERSFVLAPLVEIAPDWRHPLTGKSPAELLELLAPEPDSYEFLTTTGE